MWSIVSRALSTFVTAASCRSGKLAGRGEDRGRRWNVPTGETTGH